MSSDDEQQVPRAADNGSGDEVDGNPQPRKPEKPKDRPAGRPRQQRRSQEERRNEDNRPPQEEPWDPDPNHPGNLNIAGIAAESGRIVFIPDKKSSNDKHKNNRNDRH